MGLNGGTPSTNLSMLQWVMFSFPPGDIVQENSTGFIEPDASPCSMLSNLKSMEYGARKIGLVKTSISSIISTLESIAPLPSKTVGWNVYRCWIDGLKTGRFKPPSAFEVFH